MDTGERLKEIEYITLMVLETGGPDTMQGHREMQGMGGREGGLRPLLSLESLRGGKAGQDSQFGTGLFELF